MSTSQQTYRSTKWGKRAATRLPANHCGAEGLARTALASLQCADTSGQPNRLTHQQRAERMLGLALTAVRAEIEADR